MAHFPTYYPAIGRDLNLNQTIVSVKDQKAHTRLKFRQKGQNSKEDMKNKFEEEKRATKAAVAVDIQPVVVPQVVPIVTDQASKLETYDDDDIERSDDEQNTDEEWGGDAKASANEESENDDSDSGSDDDEEELKAELERIRAERAAANAKKQEEERAEENVDQRENALMGNPLLALGNDGRDGKIKRRWNDDVVFKNQSRSEPETKKRFINDTVRSDFHRLFMKRFIK